MTDERCKATAHDFDKFDDATIFCRKCGEQRVMDLQAAIAKMPPITYLPCPGPHYPAWTPTWKWYPYTSPTITVTSGSTTWDDSNYTVINTAGAVS